MMGYIGGRLTYQRVCQYDDGYTVVDIDAIDNKVLREVTASHRDIAQATMDESVVRLRGNKPLDSSAESQ